MNRKQRIHSAELRRLDHIARNLDRIGDALLRLHETIVSGSNNRIVEVGGNIITKDNSSIAQTNQTVGHDGYNIIQGSNNSLASSGNNSASTAGSGTANTSSHSHTQNYNDEVSESNMPMGDIKHLPHNPGTG